MMCNVHMLNTAVKRSASQSDAIASLFAKTHMISLSIRSDPTLNQLLKKSQADSGAKVILELIPHMEYDGQFDL